VMTEARSRGVKLDGAHDFVAIPGKGVTAKVNGDSVCWARGPCSTSAASRLEPIIRNTWRNWRRKDRRSCGWRAIRKRSVSRRGRCDPPRSSIGHCRIAQVGHQAHYLAHGRQRTDSERRSAQLGIAEVRASLLPQDKIEAVRALQAEGRQVA